MHLRIAFILFLTLGWQRIPSANTANTVRLISPTPYLFPQLSISGRPFNFLPPFTSRAELSTKSKPWNKNKIFKERHSNEIPRLFKVPSTVVAENTGNGNAEVKNKKSGEEGNLPSRINNEPKSTKPFETKSFENNVTNVLQRGTLQKKKKHNLHFIGSDIGGVGGVFPPIAKEASNKNINDPPSEYEQDENYATKSSYINKSKNDDSVCFHAEKTYKAGAMVHLNSKNNPCEKCRCEKREGGGIINCFWQQCEGLPALGCVPLFIPGACCPIYNCDEDELGI